jgi:hypothetical protein
LFSLAFSCADAQSGHPASASVHTKVAKETGVGVSRWNVFIKE